jgi:hypothetical protein
VIATMRSAIHWIGVLLLAATASICVAQPAVLESGWSRVVSPDGSVAVTMPCKDEKVVWQKRYGADVISCSSGGLQFGVMVGPALDPKNDKLITQYQDILAIVSIDPTKEVVVETTVRDHPAMLIRSLPSAPFGIAQAIDLQPGKPILLMVMSDSEDALTASALTRANDLAQSFLASFEDLTK